MQYPRRTSEFQEDPGTATKRNSRSTQARQSRIARPASMERQTLGLPNSVPRGSRVTPQKQMQIPVAAEVPGTANKYNGRPSRPVRPSSLERQTLGVPNSALRGKGTTPQKTPLQSTKAPRVLFTAEKLRSAHNDKIWVQEKAQQIVEHLRETAVPGSVHGLPYDFFARSGCLRQMSTKQFVGIVNHFLHYIWGTRFTVGSNYVDDIINILQKLQYPHQVNKSWLKTPNTSHSFGYVIQLFDFLMDFVPPQNEEQAAQMQFEFEDPHELSQSSLVYESPDADFIALLLENCEEGFKLWDKQLDDDKLKQQTCDVLIYKRCGVEGVAALDEQLEKLNLELAEEKKKRPHIRKEDEELCQRLEDELKDIQEQIQQARETLEITNKELDEKQAERQQCSNKLKQLVDKVDQMQSVIANQKINVEQRDALIEELEQGKYTFQLMERTLHDLEGRQHHQQVLLSRHKKQLTDQISKYNDYIRGISCTSKLQVDTNALLLPLNPQQEDVKKCLKLLEEIRERTVIQLQQIHQQKENLDKQVQELKHYISSNLKLKCTELETALMMIERKNTEFEKQKQQQIAALDAQMLEVEESLQQLETEYKNLKDQKREKKMQLAELERQNEELMNRVEKEYKKVADEREAFLNDYQEALERSNEILSEFSELVEKRELELKQIVAVEAEAETEVEAKTVAEAVAKTEAEPVEGSKQILLECKELAELYELGLSPIVAEGAEEVEAEAGGAVAEAGAAKA